VIDDIKGILELSDIDVRRLELMRKRRELPLAVEKLKKEIAGEAGMVQECADRITALEAENKQLEDTTREEKDLLRKSEDKLMHISTNAEYDAVHTEITGHKNKINAIEDRMLSNMAELEKLGPKKQELESRLNNEDLTQKKEMLIQLNAETAALDAELAVEENNRNEKMKSIGGNFVRVYERLQKNRKNGKHIGVVEDKSKICSACACSLTSQKYIEVRRNNSLQQCESCGAILVWKSE